MVLRFGGESYATIKIMMCIVVVGAMRPCDEGFTFSEHVTADVIVGQLRARVCCLSQSSYNSCNRHSFQCHHCYSYGNRNIKEDAPENPDNPKALQFTVGFHYDALSIPPLIGITPTCLPCKL